MLILELTEREIRKVQERFEDANNNNKENCSFKTLVDWMDDSVQTRRI